MRAAFAVLGLAIAVTIVPPGGAAPRSGDFVLRRDTPAAVAANPVVAEGMRRAALAAQRRAAMPDRIFAPGFNPARHVASPLRRGHRDVFDRMRANAARAAERGPAAFRTDAGGTVPGEDTIRVAILRVDFRNDREGTKSSGDGRFDLALRDTTNRPLDPTPHDRAFFASHGEAIRRYYDAQTNGRTVMEFTVYPTDAESAFHLTDMADYGPWKFSTEIYEAAVKLFHDCLVAADTTESIPWGAYDRICIIHAGSDLQSDVNQDSPLDIPTFTIGVADSDAVALGPAKADTVFAAVIAPETIRQDNFEGTINAVLCHEFGHLVFGWRDVYDVATGLPTVGYWSLMDTGNLLGNAVTFPSGTAVYAIGILPPSVDPWQKRLVYDDVPSAPLPTYGQEDAIPNSEQGFQVLRVPISGEEYLLIENRLDDLNENGQLTITRDPDTGVILGPADGDLGEYDFLIPGPGAIAWHVDESVADFFGPRADEGYGLNVRRDRFGLEIIEADGLDDLGDFNSPFALGWVTDPWFVGNATRLNSTTIPKLTTNSNTDPHLDIEFTSPPGPEMTVKVTRLWDRPGWPVRVTQPPDGVAPVVGPLGNDPTPVVVWVSGDSTLHVRTLDGLPIAGAADDVVLKTPYPLGVPAIVHSAGPAGAFIAVAARIPDYPENPAPLHVVRFQNPAAPTIETIALPSSVTAGPASDSPDAIFVGLGNGRVCQVSTTTAPAALRDRGGIGAGAVTGIAVLGQPVAEGEIVAAAGTTRTLWTGFFYAEDLDLGQAWTRDVLELGHVHQPLLFEQTPTGGGGAPQRFVAGVVDLRAGSFVAYDATSTAPDPVEPVQGSPLGEAVNAPALDDLDGDGLPEIAFTTQSGRVGYWNENGSLSPGWAPRVEREGFRTYAGPLAFTLPGVTGRPLLLASLGNGIVTALDERRKPAPGFPLGFSVGARGTPAVLDPASSGGAVSAPTLIVAGGDTLLYAMSLLGPTEVAGGSSTWGQEGGTPGRAYSTQRVFGNSGGGGPTPIVAHTLKCYPNPARRSPITFAFRLDRPARVAFKIYDAAAREVDHFERDGSASDNAMQWDPEGRTSGLYVARIEVEGQVVTAPFALVR